MTRKKCRRAFKPIAVGFLSVCIILSQTAVSFGAESKTATTLRLSSSVGAVTVADINGTAKQKTDGMRLLSGDELETSEGSYAYLDLDSAKAAKLDAVSELSIRQKGKKLELMLSAGNLFFNAKEPLGSDETMSIRTSTMVTGIRGTIGYIKYRDKNVSELFIVEGLVMVKVVNPVSGKLEEQQVAAGQKAIIYGDLLDQNPYQSEIVLSTFTEEEIDGFVRVEIARDSAMQDKIRRDGVFDVDKIIDGAEKKLADDQKKTRDLLAALAPPPEKKAGNGNILKWVRA